MNNAAHLHAPAKDGVAAIDLNPDMRVGARSARVFEVGDDVQASPRLPGTRRSARNSITASGAR
jgi:hypothetical protein